MAQDQQFYRRAANAALFGLLIQIALSVLMVLAALATQSPALHAAAYHLLGGLPIWIILLILYHQHRLERAEALETEQLSRADAQTNALFEEHADDLQLARRRLNNLYRWGLGIVSVIVSAYLLTLGGFLFYRTYSLYNVDFHKFLQDSYDSSVHPVSPVIPMVVALAIGFIAFIVGRYEAGMTKTAEWQVLRGGASFLMGNCLVALLVAIALGLKFFDNTLMLAALGLVIPALMILLGVEVLFNFLLNAYRPRRPGETPRPAFDSRILGLATTPKSLAKALSEAVNYQFGFEVSRSWFYQLVSQWFAGLVAFSIVMLILISSIVVVQPYEQVMVLQFGRIVNETEPLGPGLHFKLPWPIQTAEHYEVGRVHEISIGSASKGLEPGVAILWTKPHVQGGKEDYLVTAPTPLSVAGDDADPHGDEPATRTPGMSLIGLQVVIQYRISNLMDYVKVVDDPEGMLTRIAESRLNEFLVTQDIDTLIGHGRIGAGDRIREVVQKDVDEKRLGLQVVFAGFAGVHPPSDKDVAEAFHAQVGALQERQRLIEDAERDAIETLAKVAGSREKAMALKDAIEQFHAAERRLRENTKPEELDARTKEVKAKEAGIEDLLTKANGQAARLIYEARSYRWDRAISEKARAQQFQAELLAYHESPDLYRMRRYFEVLADGLGTSRKYIVASKQAGVPTYRIDLTDSQSAMDTIMKTNR